MRFIAKGQQAQDGEPELIEDLGAQLEKERAIIKGDLYINIHHAKGLIPDDGTTSDPYVKVTLPSSTKVQTKPINKTLTPIWNYKSCADINVQKNVREI